MSLPQLAVVGYATPGDYISHLGPRPVLREDEGPLTLCGLFLAPMRPLASDHVLRPCAMCAELEHADVWVQSPPTWIGSQRARD